MKTETIVMCVVALLLGMLLANMLTNVCGCKVVEGQGDGLPDCSTLSTEKCTDVTDIDECSDHYETQFGRMRQCGIITDSNYSHPEQLNNIGTCGRIRNPSSPRRPDGSYAPLFCNIPDVYTESGDNNIEREAQDIIDRVTKPYLDCVRGKIFRNAPGEDGSIKVENNNESIKNLVRMGTPQEDGSYLIPDTSLESCFTGDIRDQLIQATAIVDSNDIIRASAPTVCRNLATTDAFVGTDPPGFFNDSSCGTDIICNFTNDNNPDECVSLNEKIWNECKDRHFSAWSSAAPGTENKNCYDNLDQAIQEWITNIGYRILDKDMINNILKYTYINYGTATA